MEANNDNDKKVNQNVSIALINTPCAGFAILLFVKLFMTILNHGII